MTSQTVVPARAPLRGKLTLPGDKSISHRALLCGALAHGEQVIRGLAPGADVQSTRTVLQALGARIEKRGDAWVVQGDGGRSLRASPTRELDCGNSGTTMRLMAGTLAGLGIEAILVGDASLTRRPMERVAGPLRKMGAGIVTTDGHAPVRIEGGRKLRGIEHHSQVASAQVKSCLLLAGLNATGKTTVIEPDRSRDHTERLFAAMGAVLESNDGGEVSITSQKLTGIDVDVPGDLSSAAFPLIAALLIPGSEVEVLGVGLNPTRTGFVEMLDRMEADVEMDVHGSSGGEPFGRILVRGGRELLPIEAEGELVVRAIDELPALFALAAFAKGRSIFRDASELRKKESDRIGAMARGLRALGVTCEELDDGLVVDGDPGRVLTAGALLESEDDHRIAMALACASLRASGPTIVSGAEAIAISYPGFFKDLESLRSER